MEEVKRDVAQQLDAAAAQQKEALEAAEQATHETLADVTAQLANVGEEIGSIREEHLKERGANGDAVAILQETLAQGKCVTLHCGSSTSGLTTKR